MLVLTALLCTAGGSHAIAAGNRRAKIMLHVLSQTARNPCVRAANTPPNCTDYLVDSLPLYPPAVFAYVLVVNGSMSEGIGGANFGITYNGANGQGVDIDDWYLCADQQSPTPDWPASGSGNVITFDGLTNCQVGGNAVIGARAVLGYFYCSAYTPDTFRISPHPAWNMALVGNCGYQYDGLLLGNDACTSLGAVGFGSGRTGINPCGCEPLHGVCPGAQPCTFPGPSTVPAGETRVYRCDWDGQKDWNVTGNATIVGRDDLAEVTVQAGAPGSFELTVDTIVCCDSPFPFRCGKIVSVEQPVTVEATTWSRLKVLTGPRGDRSGTP